MIVTFIVAFVAAVAFTPLVKMWASWSGKVAQPRADRWHSKPVALMGGVAIGSAVIIATAAGLIWNRAPLPQYLIGLLVSSVMMFVTGLIDDLKVLKPNTKIILEALAAAILISFGAVYHVAPFTIVNVVFTIFWYIALTNAMNLLDNMDGITAGTTAIVAFGFAALFADTPSIAMVALAVAGTCIGFLVFNFSPASIFMGDAGSLFLGSALAGLGAVYSTTHVDNPVEGTLLPILLVLVPVMDTTLVMSTRLLARRPVTVGGRDHVTHRLAFIGLKDWQVALAVYAVAAGASLLTVDLSHGFSPVTAVISILFILSMIMVARYLARLPIHPVPAPTRTSHISMLVDELLYKLRILDAVVDLLVFAAAYWAAYLLRWDGAPPVAQSRVLIQTLAVVAAVRLTSFYIAGIYRGVWHQISVRDVHRLVRGVAIGTLLEMAVVLPLFGVSVVGISLFLIDAMLVLLFAFGVRLSLRSFDIIKGSFSAPGLPTLIFGVGRGGELTLRELSANRDYGLTPVGFLDDDSRKHGKLVHGLPVLGGRDQIVPLATTMKVQRVVIGTRILAQETIQEIKRACDEADIEVMQLRIGLTPVLQLGTDREVTELKPLTAHPRPLAAGEKRKQRVLADG